MKEIFHQGDILKIEKISKYVLVVSKDFFNQSEEIIGCPIFFESTESPLHIKVTTSKIEGYVQCEKLTLFDMKVRGATKIDSIAMSETIDITDAIQGIFDYI